jgi:hypothetical protein
MNNEITVRSVISGLVNGQPMRGTILAALDPNRGGRSTCEFSLLPADFTPGTFATHT